MALKTFTFEEHRRRQAKDSRTIREVASRALHRPSSPYCWDSDPDSQAGIGAVIMREIQRYNDCFRGECECGNYAGIMRELQE